MCSGMKERSTVYPVESAINTSVFGFPLSKSYPLIYFITYCEGERGRGRGRMGNGMGMMVYYTSLPSRPPPFPSSHTLLFIILQHLS